MNGEIGSVLNECRNVENLKEDCAYQFYILVETPFNINVSLHTYLKWHGEPSFYQLGILFGKTVLIFY